MKEGDRVKTGDKLLKFDPKLIREKGFDMVNIGEADFVICFSF